MKKTLFVILYLFMFNCLAKEKPNRPFKVAFYKLHMIYSVKGLNISNINQSSFVKLDYQGENVRIEISKEKKQYIIGTFTKDVFLGNLFWNKCDMNFKGKIGTWEDGSTVIRGKVLGKMKNGDKIEGTFLFK